MTFPTIPTGGRVVTGVQADTSATRIFPNLSGLTKNSGDLLIAIVIAYQSSATANAVWSGWSSGWTEFGDQSTTTTMAIGAAYKWSDGTETGTISVTQAATITGHACFILLSIPGGDGVTAPVMGGYASGTTTAANPTSLTSGFGALDTLWIAVAGNGETATTGTFTGVATAPTNYTNGVFTAISSDVVGGVNAGVAFRQLNAASEDVGAFGLDVSSARSSAVTIAVRPNTNATATPAVVAASTSIPTPLVNAVNVTPSTVLAAATIPALTGNIVPNLDAKVTIPTPTISDGSFGATVTPSVVSATTSVPTPTVTTGAANVSPTRVSAVATIPTPVVSAAETWFKDTLVGGSGNPMLLVSAEDWAVLCNGGVINSGDYETTWNDYFAERQSQGFNGIMVSVFATTFFGGDMNDWDGLLPFGASGTSKDPTQTPNTEFWHRRDLFISIAASYGFVVIMNASTPLLDFGATPASWTTTQWQTFGTFLGNRYASAGNLLWMVGDDYFGGIDSNLTAWLTNLRAAGANQPISIQNPQETTVLWDLFGDTEWAWGRDHATYNNLYTYNVTYPGVERLHVDRPMPHFWMDGMWLNTGSLTGWTDKEMIRRMTWWALSSGTRGFQIGNNSVWTWSGTSEWTEVQTNTFYTQQVPAIKSAFTGVKNWHRLVPDVNNLLVTAGRGTKDPDIERGGAGFTSDSSNYVSASRTPDGTSAVIFMPHGTTITIDQTKMVAGYIPKWVDPANGAETVVSASSTYNSTARGNNSAGDDDWLLILQAPANATITPSVIGAGTSFGAATVKTGSTVSASVVSASVSVPAPTVATGSTVSPAAVAATTTIPTPAISSRATVTPTVVNASATIGAPTVGAGVGITATVVAGSTSIPTPSISTSGNASVSPTVVSASIGIPAPTVSAGNSATVTPAVVAAVTAIAAPTVKVGVTLTPGVVNASTTIPAPAVSAGGSATVSAAVVSATTSVGAPTISTGQRATASVVSAATTIPTPTIGAGTGIFPAVVSASTTIPAPTVKVGSTTGATVVPATTSIPTPAVSAGGSVTVTPTVVNASTSIATPVVKVGITATPVRVSASVTIPTPTVTAGSSANVTASTVNGITTIPIPAITAGGSATVSAATVQATSSVTEPVVTTASNATAAPAVVTVTTTVPGPAVSVTQSAFVTPATVYLTTLIEVPVNLAYVPMPTPPSRILSGTRRDRIIKDVRPARIARD